MKTKIKTLIKESRTLSEEEKQNYLKIIDFLPEKNLKELLAILENEKTAIKEFEESVKIQKSDINKKYIQNFEELYQSEYKSAVKEEEKEEKNKADDILKNIND